MTGILGGGLYLSDNTSKVFDFLEITGPKKHDLVYLVLIHCHIHQEKYTFGHFSNEKDMAEFRRNDDDEILVGYARDAHFMK